MGCGENDGDTFVHPDPLRAVRGSIRTAVECWPPSRAMGHTRAATIKPVTIVPWRRGVLPTPI